MCVFTYSLFNSSMTKRVKHRTPEKTVKVLKCTIKFLAISFTVVPYTTRICTSKKCGSNFTMNYTFNLGFRLLCLHDCNAESSELLTPSFGNCCVSNSVGIRNYFIIHIVQLQFSVSVCICWPAFLNIIHIL